jgi:DNA-binding GntR family transcriptional regulator
VRNADTQRIEALNHEFHRAVNTAARAPKLAWLLRATVRYAPQHFFASIPGWVEASLVDHEAIIEALHVHEPERAAEAMRGHILHAGELLGEHLERRSADSLSSSRQDLDCARMRGGSGE